MTFYISFNFNQEDGGDRSLLVTIVRKLHRKVRKILRTKMFEPQGDVYNKRLNEK